MIAIERLLYHWTNKQVLKNILKRSHKNSQEEVLSLSNNYHKRRCLLKERY